MTNAHKLPLLLAVSALGLAFAALVGVLTQGKRAAVGESVSPGAGPKTVQGKRQEGPDAELAVLRERLDAVVAENRNLRDRLAMVEARPADTRVPVGDGVTKAQLAEVREEIIAWVNERMAERADSPEFIAHIAGALEDIRKGEKVDEVRQYQEKRNARLDGDVAKIQWWLTLDSAQPENMRTALQLQYEREERVRQLWEDGADDELLGEEKRTAGEDFQRDLAEFLTEDQLTTFWSRIGGGKGR